MDKRKFIKYLGGIGVLFGFGMAKADKGFTVVTDIASNDGRIEGEYDFNVHLKRMTYQSEDGCFTEVQYDKSGNLKKRTVFGPDGALVSTTRYSGTG